MAEKRENIPTPPKKQRRYRETIDLESASGWRKWNLDLFKVHFSSSEYTDLKAELGVGWIPPEDAQFDEGDSCQ